MILVVVCTIFIACGFISGLLFLAQGPQYAQSSNVNADIILTFTKKYTHHRILDLGSGDGKLILLLARQGFKVDGVELNPWLVLKSRRALAKAGLTNTTHIYWGNFWRYNVTPYDLVVVFAIKHVMPRLEEKVLKETRSGTYIISNFFEFTTLKKVDQQGDIKVYQV